MKTNILKTLLCAAMCIAALFSTGCTTMAKLNDIAKQADELGLKEVEITGKFSHTDYKVEVLDDGTRRGTLDHSNAWVPKTRIVRETKPKQD